MALTQISTKGIKDGTITGTDLATNVDLVDNQKLRLGASQDLQLYHASGNSIIANSTGYLELNANAATWLKTTQLNVIDNDATQYHLRTFKDNQVELYYDNSKKFETTSAGVKVQSASFATLEVRATGASDGVLKLVANNDENTDWTIRNDYSESNDLDIRFDNARKMNLDTSGNLFIAGNLDLEDNDKLLLGAGDDLQIYHDGSNSYVIDSGTGNFYIGTNDFNVTNAAVTESFIKAVENGQVELYYNNSKKFETTSDGAYVSGHLNFPDASVSTGRIRMGAGDDLMLYHDGSDSFITNSTGTLKIQTQVNIDSTDGSEHIARFIPNNQVELYYDGNKKLETTSDGVHITHNFLGVNVSSASGTFGDRNAHLAMGDTDTGVAQNGDGQLELWANNQEIVNIDTGEITAYKTLRPNSNNSHELGGSSHRWSTIYSQNALNTSDKNLKNTITDSELGLSFINKLRPVSYKWNQKEGEVSDTKTHYGLIAQEVEAALASEGKTLDNFAGVYKPDDYKEDGTGGAMAIAVSELISPLIKAIQELSAEVAALKGS